MIDVEADNIEAFDYEVVEKFAPIIKDLASNYFPDKTESELKDILTNDELVHKIFNVYYVMNDT